MNSFRRAVSLLSSSYLKQFNNIRLLKREIRTQIKVNEYLLNRSIPFSDILKNLNEEDSKELNNIKIYYEFLLSSGNSVPKKLTDEHYVELLCLSKNQRIKYYSFLAKVEYKRENAELRAKIKCEKKEEEMEKFSGDLVNRFMSKYHNKIVERLEINRLLQSIVLQSQEVVFDVSFENTMSRMEIKNLAMQILYCHSLNKTLKEPFQMVLANMNPLSILYSDLVRNTRVGTENCASECLEHMPWVVDKRHYLDIFPGRRLVYLSPNSTKFFTQGEYDHEAVHIVGGIVDKSGQAPLTLARARKEEIEHRAFPIDRFIPWKSGNKSLTLNQAMSVLAIARETNGDWKTALEESIPRRSLIDNSFKHQRKMMKSSVEGGDDYDEI